jgi:capsid protein
MSLQTRIESLVQRLAIEFKTVYGEIGALANLSTVDKTDLVSAINELRNQIVTASGGAFIDDDHPHALTTTFSASKITSLLDALKVDILGGADAAFDTLKELQDALTNDATGLPALLEALGHRVRFDGPQVLTLAEQAQARTNIGAVSQEDIGDPDTDFLVIFETALV